MENMLLDRINNYANKCKDYKTNEFILSSKTPILIFDFNKINMGKEDIKLFIRNKIYSAISTKFEFINIVFIYNDFNTSNEITLYIFKELKKLTFYPLLFSSLKITIITNTIYDNKELSHILSKTNNLLVINTNTLDIDPSFYDSDNRYLVNLTIKPNNINNLANSLINFFNIHRKPIYLSLDKNSNWSDNTLKELKKEIHIITEVMVNDISSNSYNHLSSYQPILFNIFRIPLENPTNYFTYYPNNINKLDIDKFNYILKKENYYFNAKSKKLNNSIYSDNLYYYDIASGYRYIAKIGKYLDYLL